LVVGGFGGDSDGSFQEARLVGATGQSIAVGDFDGDGFWDLAVVNTFTPQSVDSQPR
jgi:hypothetical protein